MALLDDLGLKGHLATISSKYQMTLPMAVVRALQLRPGDKLRVGLEGENIVLRPQPRDWVAALAGSGAGYYGKTREEVAAYLAEVRGDWDLYLPEDEESPSANG